MKSNSIFSSLFSFFFISNELFCFTLAYIPATPNNDSISQNLIQNSTDQNWFIQLNWHPIGIFSDGVNRLLQSNNTPTSSLHQGVLLHFSEVNATSQAPANVPWIAMINCDTNTSSFSMVDDIFTLARDRGAAAAVLYSLTARSCSVNTEYILNFEKPLDVFSSANLQGARLIESQFSNVIGSGYWFQSDLLNTSASAILNEISQTGYAAAMTPASTLSVAAPESTPDAAPSLFGESSNNTRFRRSLPHVNAFELAVTNSNSVGVPKSNPSKANNSTPVYLIATLANGNAMSNSQQQSNTNSNNNNNNNNGGSNANTGLAMIILYAITGCVTLMFLIVIISGAIRAMRHPERYGPRPAGHPSDSDETDGEDPNLGHQTRVAGLTRAILDTFPVVKFGRSILPIGSERVTEKKDPVMGPVDEESFMMQDCGQTYLNSPNQSLNKHPVKIDTTTSEAGDETVVLESLALSNLLSTQLEDQVKGNHSDTTIISPSNDDHQSSKIPPVTTILTSSKPNESSSSLPDKQKSSGDDTELHTGSSHPIDGLTELSSTQTQKAADHAASETAGDESEMVGDVNNSVTCPICVCDFDDDDDIRVLPCDARHRFHQECVDPWLLNVSRFCPLCRWDLSTRKDGTKIAGEETSEDTTNSSGVHTNPTESSRVAEPSNAEERRSTSSTTDRPTEAQIVANLRAMLQNSRHPHQSHQNQSRSGGTNEGSAGGEEDRENQSRFKKYISQVRGKARFRRRQDP
ncbi:hypothetical protein DFH28DRAFT_1153470 [Melampsora americana]|nr:hypothetical protein DFH28DRAFT_1153470 [Melampsora americana]